MRWQAVAVPFVLAMTMATASCSGPAPSGITIPKEFAKFVSPDTSLIAGINFESLRSSPLYAKYKSALNLQALDQFAQGFGLDPRRDLNQLVYVADAKNQLILAHGAFRVEEVEGKLQKQGLTRQSYKGFDVWGDARNSVGIRKGFIAAGSADVLRRAIDTAEAGQGEVPAEIADHLRSIPKGDQLWIVSRNGLPFASAASRTDIQSALSNIVGFVKDAEGSLGISSGLQLHALLGCISPEGATRVHDALRGTIAIGRLSTKDNETWLLKIYDSVQVERKDTSVHVNAQLTGDQVEELVRRFGKQ